MLIQLVAVAAGNPVNKNSHHINPPSALFHRGKEKDKTMNQIRGHPKAGFTLVEIMIVVAIIGLLAAIGIPNFVKARETSQTNACINNLRMIDEAKQEWGLELGQAAGVMPSGGQLAPYMGHTGNVMPFCPLSGATGPAYNIQVLTNAPTCPNSNNIGHDAFLPI
jgi:prepilin-type N-terminal cleavage/methylation domain-containing protein